MPIPYAFISIQCFLNQEELPKMSCIFQLMECDYLESQLRGKECVTCSLSITHTPHTHTLVNHGLRASLLVQIWLSFQLHV